MRNLLESFLPFILLFAFSLSSGQETKHNSIVWTALELEGINLEKGALMLPVQFGAKTCLLQLDLGRPDSYIFKSELNKIPGENVSINADEIEIKGELSKLKFAHTFNLYDNKNDTVNPPGKGSNLDLIGVLGLNFFLDKKLYLDFINDQFGIIDSKQNFAFEISHGFSIPCKISNNKMLIKTTLKDKDFWFFYDTGASHFPMVTDKNHWIMFTHNDSSDKVSATVKIPAKNNNENREIIFFADTIRDNIQLGNISFKNQLVYYESKDSFDFSSFSPELTGVIGNAIFFDKYKVLIDFNKQTFEIMSK